MSDNYDHTPLYTVKQVCKKTGLTPHAIRFYDNSGLLPKIARSEGNVRLFSEYDLSWLQVVHCFRSTGMSIADIKHYIDLCLKGEETIEERFQIILQQEKRLKEQIQDLNSQMKILQSKKAHYAEMRENKTGDTYNPLLSRIPETDCLKEMSKKRP